MSWLLSIVGYIFAWIAYVLDNNYLKECVDDFYNTYSNYKLKSHWFWIKLPKVKQIYSKSVRKNMIKTKPIDLPNGLIFELDYD